MYKISLEYLQWDLYRETKNAPYASTIIKINNFLKSTSNTSISDKEKIEAIRKIKNFISQLEVKQYQGAVETNELEMTIKNAVEKNKNIDIDAPFKKGDRILFWSVSNENNLNGKIATLTKRVNRFGDSNVFNISVDDTGKNYSWIFSSHFFRTQGCLPDSEICVGVPVSYLNNSATVLGISTYFGGDVVIQVDKTKEQVMVPSIMLFKKAGCSRNFPVCVGDKLIDYKDNSSLKFVKAVSLYNLNLVMLGKSIYDDNLVGHSLTNGDKIINKTELIEINNLK